MAATVVPPTPLIDWHALFQVLYISAASSIGLVLLFTLGVYALSSFQHKDSMVLYRGFNGLIVTVASVGILGMIVWGFYYIVNK